MGSPVWDDGGPHFAGLDFCGMQLNHKHALGIYALFFFGLFFQFPLNEALPGNCDTLFSIAFGNSYLNKIKAVLTGEVIGTYLYPSDFAYGYGESSFLGLSIFSFLRFLGFSNIVAYYFFISLIFISSAFSIYLLATCYTKNSLAALFAGFAFSCSNFSFANIDDSVVLLFFIAALSTYLLKKHIASGKINYLYFAFISAGFQTYINAYVFLFQFVMMATVLLCHIRKIQILNKHFLGAVLIHIGMILPFFGLYLYSHFNLEIINPWPSKIVILDMALKPGNFTGVLPHNLLYDPAVSDHFFWKSIRQHAFLGGAFYILVIIGFFKKQKHQTELLIIALTGMAMAIGPYLKIGSVTIPGPMALVYGLSPAFELFRVPHRAFFMTSLVLSICAARGVTVIASYFKTKQWGRLGNVIVVSIFLLHFFENTPFPLASYASIPIIERLFT
jgi:hypothetical protein